MKKTITIIIITFFISSCSHQLRLKDLVKTNKMEAKIANNDASRRNAYFIYDSEKNKVITLSEPPPDAIVSQITSLTNKLNLKSDINTEQSVSLTESIIQLGQRTVAVNILRDALFRLNEMNVNNQNQLMDTISAKLFERILSVSESISIADIKKADAQKIEADAKLIEAKTENNKSSFELLKFSNLNDLESQAFQSLIDKDITNSFKYFEKLETTSPGFHNAYEIYNLLKEFKNKPNTEIDWNAIYKTIKEKYSWGMPEKLKQNFN